MGAWTDQSPEPEQADLNKIKSNLWSVTGNTRQLSDLCRKLEGLFTHEEKELLTELKDEQLKCFTIYAKFLREGNDEHQSLLLRALRSTGNADVADQIKRTCAKGKNYNNNNQLEARDPITKAGTEIPLEGVGPGPLGSSRAIHYEIKGKARVYNAPGSLKISQSLQHTLTSLTLSELQISKFNIRAMLEPCGSLQHLTLLNVLFPCPVSSAASRNDSSSILESPLTLPQLKSYTFNCDKESSLNYPWETIFFFSLHGNQSSTLLSLWRNQVQISVQSLSMELSLTEKSIRFKLPKREFYDSPSFVPYVQKEHLQLLFKELSNIESLVCLLPPNFDTINFNDLPNALKALHISGLKLDYDHEDNNKGERSFRNYKRILMENCRLSGECLDDLSVIFPLATSIELKDCQIDDCDGADINILIS